MSMRPELLPGDPPTVQAEAGVFGAVAEALRLAAELLENLASGDLEGLAIEAVLDDTAELAQVLERVHPRYRETDDALSIYAVRLADAQDDARAAVTAEADAFAALWPLRREKEEIQRELSELLFAGEGEESRADRLERELALVQERIRVHESRIEDAWSSMSVATADRDDAADRAIRRIRHALEEFDDRLRDRAAAVAAAVLGLGGAVADWIADVVTAIVDALITLATAIAIALAVIVAILAVIALLVLLAPLFSVVLAALGAATLLVLSTLVKVALVALVVIAVVIAVAIVREGVTPAPRLLPRSTKRVGSAEGSDVARYDPQDPYGAQLRRNDRLDVDGGADETHVEIAQVLDETGAATGAWRVTLPSTQDWELMNGLTEGVADPRGDQGALNDLGSNIALMIAPDVQGAYERSVIQAMHDAGIGPDDPVMLTGWSQGGILAGKMASDAGLPFSIDAVFAAGAPIDHFDIPNDVAVVSIQHSGDVVPMLDLVGPRQQPNWVTIIDEPLEITGAPGSPHSARTYALTADRASREGELPPSVREQQQQFFTGFEMVRTYVGAEGR